MVGVAAIPKSVKVLTLGHNLTQKQMRTICESLRYLKELSLPQMKSPVDVYMSAEMAIGDGSRNKTVTLSQFKRACRLPKLRKLSISTASSKLESIREFASDLVGIYENPGTTKRGDVEYTIDRKLFFLPS